MTIVLFCLTTVLAVSLLLDALVRPRRKMSALLRGRQLHLLLVAAFFGLFLAFSGGAVVSGLLTVALVALFTVVSNAKQRFLGEPLVFSDLALVVALFRHPRFYFTALSTAQKALLTAAAPLLVIALSTLYVRRIEPHIAGVAIFLLSLASLVALISVMRRRGDANAPDLEADLHRHGLIGTLLLYWLRWRETVDPNPIPPVSPAASAVNAPDLLIVVQCESFADPVELTGDIDLALPGLAQAREQAWQWGNLTVSGFGAYTMRTEYGVLFGRSEQELGFRRYDPFLTAHGETSYALPARLRNFSYRCFFVHPHDMRFYGRDRLMPAAGFDTLIGESSFPPLPPGNRYVDDGALGRAIGALIDQCSEPTLVYAVTMENHGPWSKDELTGSPGGLGAYMRHLHSSDAMLAGQIDHLRRAGRSALLVFFGDHRPSIPGVLEPGGARHTPYVIVRVSASGEIVKGANKRVDLTPDQLHKAVLDTVVAQEV